MIGFADKVPEKNERKAPQKYYNVKVIQSQKGYMFALKVKLFAKSRYHDFIGVKMQKRPSKRDWNS